MKHEKRVTKNICLKLRTLKVLKWAETEGRGKSFFVFVPGRKGMPRVSKCQQHNKCAAVWGKCSCFHEFTARMDRSLHGFDEVQHRKSLIASTEALHRLVGAKAL